MPARRFPQRRGIFGTRKLFQTKPMLSNRALRSVDIFFLFRRCVELQYPSLTFPSL